AAGAGAGHLPEGVRAADGRRAACAVGGPGGGAGAAGEEGPRPRPGRADACAPAGGEERLREAGEAALLTQAAHPRAGGTGGPVAERLAAVIDRRGRGLARTAPEAGV